MSTTTTEIIDGTVYEVQTDDDGTVSRTPVGPAPVDRFDAFADALAEALADDETSAREAIAQALAAVT